MNNLNLIILKEFEAQIANISEVIHNTLRQIILIEILINENMKIIINDIVVYLNQQKAATQKKAANTSLSSNNKTE